MRSHEILMNVRGLQIPERELVVVGGAALTILGIKRSTGDLDAVVTQQRLLEEAANTRHLYRSTASAPISHVRRGQIVVDVFKPVGQYSGVMKSGDITLMPAPNDSKYQVTFEELRDTALSHEGVLVANPELLLDWKQSVGRQKDLRDAERIEAYLAQ